MLIENHNFLGDNIQSIDIKPNIHQNSLFNTINKNSVLLIKKQKRSHNTCIHCVVTKNKNTIAFGGLDGVIKILHYPSLEYSKILIIHKDCINSLLFTEDDYLISGSDDCSMILWDLKTGIGLKKLTEHSKGVSSIVCIDKSYLHKSHKTNFNYFLASASWDKTIKIWNLTINKVISVFSGHLEGIKTLIFDKNFGGLLSGSLDGEIRIWDLQKFSCIHKVKAHDGKIWSMIQPAESEIPLMTSGSDKKIKLWNYNLSCTGEFDGTKDIMKIATISQNLFVSSAGLKNFQVKRLSDNSIIKEYETSPDTIFHLCQLDSNKFVVAAGYNLKIFHVVDKKKLFFQIMIKTKDQFISNPFIVRNIYEMLFSSL